MDKELEKLLNDPLWHIGSEPLKPQEFCSTGSYVLDYITGGGYAKGHITHIYGKKSSGKSLLSLVAASQQLAQDKIVIYCDLENNYASAELDEYRKLFGVSGPNILTLRPACAEDVIDKTVALLEKCAEKGQEIALMVVDSTDALASTKSLEKGADEAEKMAENAKMLKRWCKKLNILLPKTNTACVMISHMIANIGSFRGGDTQTGGSGIAHFNKLSLRVSGIPVKKEKATDFDQPLGHSITVVCEKNKQTFPGKKGEVYFDYSTMSFDHAQEIVILGLTKGFIQAKGSWMEYTDDNGEVHRGQGKHGLATTLVENNALDGLVSKIFSEM